MGKREELKRLFPLLAICCTQMLHEDHRPEKLSPTDSFSGQYDRIESFPYVGIAISQNQYWRICSRNSLVMG